MVNTKINLCGIKIDNPIIPSSGTFGYGYEFNNYYDINILGTFSIKGTTLNPRFGNPTPRIAESASGILNAVGLQNPGVEKVINEEFKKLKKVYHKKVIANVSGFAIDEYVAVAKKFDKNPLVGWIELNISCPNVKHGGMSFGTDPKLVFEVTKKVKSSIKKPLIVKLSPNVTSIVEIAKAAEKGGADALALVNTFLGLRINLKTKTFILKNRTGGLSGPAIFPIALRMVNDVYNAVKIPIIGMGGIASAEDVIEMMLAGATAVQIGSSNLIDPCCCKKIIEELPNVMKKYGIEDLSKIIGGVKNA